MGQRGVIIPYGVNGGGKGPVVVSCDLRPGNGLPTPHSSGASVVFLAAIVLILQKKRHTFSALRLVSLLYHIHTHLTHFSNSEDH